MKSKVGDVFGKQYENENTVWCNREILSEKFSLNLSSFVASEQFSFFFTQISARNKVNGAKSCVWREWTECAGEAT